MRRLALKSAAASVSHPLVSDGTPERYRSESSLIRKPCGDNLNRATAARRTWWREQIPVGPCTPNGDWFSLPNSDGFLLAAVSHCEQQRFGHFGLWASNFAWFLQDAIVCRRNTQMRWLAGCPSGFGILSILSCIRLGRLHVKIIAISPRTLSGFLEFQCRVLAMAKKGSTPRYFDIPAAVRGQTDQPPFLHTAWFLAKGRPPCLLS
jgi:hypothetical protein